MRTKAFILFFPFAVFLLETASFIPVMREACVIMITTKNLCKKTERPGQCTGKKEKTSCAKMKTTRQCGNKKTTSDKTSNNKCADNRDCSTCPVCYTFIFQQQFEWPVQEFSFRKNYRLLTADNISSFTPDVWKPPNGFLYA